MTTFEEIQDKGLLAAKGLQSLLMEGIGAVQGVGQAVGQGIGRTTQAVGQTTQAVGSGLSSLLEQPIEGFKGLDPYTRAEIGGLVGQVLGEAITGQEAPKMAETIRQVPAVLRERKEKQQEKQIEKLKLLREIQADERKEERAERKDAREERKLQSDIAKKDKKKELSAKDIVLAKQGRRGVDVAKNLLQDISTSEIFQAEFAGRVAGEKAKKIRAALRNAIDPLIRFRTGAAITPRELTFYEESFLPMTGDTEDVVLFKIQQLDDMIKYMEGKEPSSLVNDGLKKIDNISKEIEQEKESNINPSYSGNVTTSKGNISYNRLRSY